MNCLLFPLPSSTAEPVYIKDQDCLKTTWLENIKINNKILCVFIGLLSEILFPIIIKQFLLPTSKLLHTYHKRFQNFLLFPLSSWLM